jgi:hypothetical protein
MILFCIGLGVGMFCMLFLICWLDERDDMYANIKVDELLGNRQSSRYYARVHPEAIQSVCAYCRKKTTSLYCKGHGVYYCMTHNAKAHKDCV